MWQVASTGCWGRAHRLQSSQVREALALPQGPSLPGSKNIPSPPHQGHAHLCPTWGLVWPRPGCRARDGLVSLAYGPGAQLQQKQGEPTCELGRSLPLVSMRVSQQAGTSVRPPLLAAGSTALSVLPNLSKPIS